MKARRRHATHKRSRDDDHLWGQAQSKEPRLLFELCSGLLAAAGAQESAAYKRNGLIDRSFPRFACLIGCKPGFRYADQAGRMDVACRESDRAFQKFVDRDVCSYDFIGFRFGQGIASIIAQDCPFAIEHLRCLEARRSLPSAGVFSR